ncbi:MAG TPA: helix-turn-helix domain-containing protein [Propionicimonas sp.]|uniref:TetR/AcrR family transcriptional regulator n=1 Tax=Propionicimonas sp. TaxID=1955623 RepID=UPI002F3E5391
MTPQDSATRILDAAAGLFAGRGYQATTTRMIAEASGLNEVTIFRSFSNKQGVLAAVVGRVAARQPGKALADLQDVSVREAVRRLAQLEVVNGLADGGLMTRLAFEAGTVPEVAELFAGGPQGNLDAMTGFFAARQSAGEVREDLPPAVLAEAFFSLTSSFVIMRTFLGLATPDAGDRDVAVDQLLELFWNGASK